ncbi:trigger factor [bacterium]|nr:trigger factor [bacterium]
MKIELEKQEHNLVKINIEIPAKDAVEAYNKASMRISQHMNIPGFRKGKAPRNVVEQHIGSDRIKYEALESLLPRVFQQAISENNLDVISQPMVESYDFKIGEDLKITANVETRPEFELKEYKDMTVDVEEFKIPEDAYEKSLNNILDRAATYEVVLDRPANNTDIVKIDFEAYSEGKKVENTTQKDYVIDLSRSNFIPGFAEQLVGHSVGEEFDISVNFPEEDDLNGLREVLRTFKVKMHEIKQRIRPELNEELAKKLGFDTVEALQNDIKDFLQKDKEQRDYHASEQAVMDKVVNNVEIDIQDSMIKREQDVLLNEYKDRLAQQGFTYEQAVEQQGEESILKQAREDAVRRIKNTLIIEKIAKLENISLDSSDMTSKLNELQSMYRLEKNELLKQLSMNPSIISSLSQQILSEKVTKFLVDNNKINYVSKVAENA